MSKSETTERGVWPAFWPTPEHKFEFRVDPPLPPDAALIMILRDGECLFRVVSKANALLLEPALIGKDATDAG